MRGDGGTSDLAETGEDVDDTRWEAGLLDESASNEGGERSLLSSLQDHDVASSNSRANLPRPHEQWEVPWDDLTANADLNQLALSQHDKLRNTYRLLLYVVEGVWGRVYDLALNLICPTAIVPQAASASTDIAPCHGDGLAVVQRFNRGQKL